MPNSSPRDFWSRRRAAVQAEDEAARQAEVAEAQAAVLRETEARNAEKTDDQILTELGLQDPDSLHMGDDFAAFLQTAVPEHLRRRALRRLWRSNPVLANLDGLVDFGEDFTDAAMVQPGMQTTYQVGRGMMRHIVALAEQAEAEARADLAAKDPAPEAVPTPEQSTAMPADAAEAADDDIELDDAEQASPRDTYADEDPAPRPRRHMRFAYSS